jgi:hypothetical protein
MSILFSVVAFFVAVELALGLLAVVVAFVHGE